VFSTHARTRFPHGSISAIYVRARCEIRSDGASNSRRPRYCGPGRFSASSFLTGPDRAAAICQGDSIQSHVIGVISLPRLSVAQSVRALNVCGITRACRKCSRWRPLVELILHLPSIYISVPISVEQIGVY